MKALLALFGARTDEQSMWRVKMNDDHVEFTRLVKKWEEPIYRLCVRMMGNLQRGEDLKQEVFLRLFQKRKEYEVSGKFSTFLWRMALNLCFDELRKQQRRSKWMDDRETNEDEECAADSPGPDAQTAQFEEGELVRRAVMQLPEIYRAVVVMRHYENMKFSKIAEILELPEGTVNSRMAEALVRLNRALRSTLRPETVLNNLSK